MSGYSIDNAIKAYQSNSILNSKPKHVVKGYGQNSSRSSNILSKGFVPSSSASLSTSSSSLASNLGISRKMLVTSASLVIPDSPIKGSLANPIGGEFNNATQVAVTFPRGANYPLKILGRPGGSLLPPSIVRKVDSVVQKRAKDNSYTEDDDDAVHRKREKEYELEMRNRKSAIIKAKAVAQTNSLRPRLQSLSEPSAQVPSNESAIIETFAKKGNSPSSNQILTSDISHPMLSISDPHSSHLQSATAPSSSCAPAASSSSPMSTSARAMPKTITGFVRPFTVSTSSSSSSTLTLLARAKTAPQMSHPLPPNPPSTISSASGDKAHERIATRNLPNAPALPSGQISDNFVRRNLKKKGSYRQKQKDPRFQHKTRGGGDREGERGSEDDQDGHGSDVEDAKEQVAGSGASQKRHVAHGLASMGLDPLQLSLDAIKQHQVQDSSATSRGSMKSEAVLSKAASGRQAVPRVIKMSRNGSMNDATLEEHAPCCPGHQLAAKLLVVKKAGPNKNRRFYGCSYSSDQRCKFFMWAEDNPTLVSLALKSTEAIAGAQQGQGALESYTARLETLSTVELKDEIRRFQKRRILTQRKGVKLTLTGKREALVRLLTQEAAAVLGQIIPDSEHDRALKPHKELGAASIGRSDDSSLSRNRAQNLRYSTLKGITDGLLPNRSKIRASAIPNSSHNSPAIIDSNYDELDSLELNDDQSDSQLCDESEVDEEEDSEDSESEDESEDALGSGRRVRHRTASSSSALTASAPVYTLGEDPLLDQLRAIFGHSSLRSGQRWAIDRCVDGKSSLLVMPTGSGKSLCYMLPAAALPGITLVVCPLISLMQDQIKKLPPELPAACFSGSPTAYESAQISQALLLGNIKVLFVSPERLCTPSFRSLMQTLNNATRQRLGDPSASAISLLCVDEAHCLSQWSYNFRPSFLRIRREIRILEPRAVLALTATAPPHIQRDIMTHLGIDLIDGLLALPPRRSNLVLSARIVDGDEQKRIAVEAIIRGESAGLLRSADEKNGALSEQSIKNGRLQRGLAGKRGRSAGGVRRDQMSLNIEPTIIYVWMRHEVEALSEYLTAVGLPAVGYHAGMDADKRQRAQQAFMRGTSRIVVATVAFGMGVDKSDVRCVIHSSIPKSVENYLQETGRAGRDGIAAHCHLLLNKEDLEQQHSLSYSTQLSVVQVAALLTRVFVPATQLSSSVAVRLSLAERECDLSDATVETIFSVLELPPFSLLQVEGVHLDTMNGQFRCTGPALAAFRIHDPIIKALHILDKHLSERDRECQRAGIRSSSNSSIITSGMGSMATYGFGSGGAEADKDDVATAAAAYGRQPFGPLSLLQLSGLSGLTRDECARGLHSLQTRGVLEYTLSEPAVYLTVIGSGMEGEKWDWEPAHFPSTVWRLACVVCETINGITDLASDKTLDMWRLGCTVAKCGKNDDECSTVTRFKEQEQISEFLCQYMLSLSSPHEVNAVDQPLGELQEIFNASSVPLLRLSNVDSEDGVAAKRELACLLRDINVLRQDPRLLDLLKGLETSVTSHALIKTSLSGNSDLANDVQIAIKNMMALYITRIFHGLATPLLTNKNWRGNQFWSKFRKVHFKDIFRVSLEELNQIC